MDFQAVFDNYKRILTDHYFDMRGRVGRSEFWYFVLANFIACLLAGIVGGILHLPLGELYNLAVLLPSMSIGARRLQDTGRSGQLVWLMFILAAVTQIAGLIVGLAFLVGGGLGILFVPGLTFAAFLCFAVMVVLIWFWCPKGDPGDNAYGPVPPVFDPNRPGSTLP